MNTYIGVKKTMFLSGILPVALLLALGACQTGPSPEQLAKEKAEAENTRLIAELQGRDSLIGDMTRSFDDIEKNLSLVAEREQVVTTEASGSDLGVDQRQRIARDIKLMNSLMSESRTKVAELTQRLDRSKIEASGLRKKLKELDLMLASRDSAITNMKDQLLARDFKVVQVNEQLTAIELEVAKREAIIHQQETELNKAFVALGTYKELEAKGVLTKEGGVVGIGKRVALKDGAGTGSFKEVDVRELHTVPLKGEKAVLVTEHPKDSYRIVEEDDHLAYLEIKDPNEFWRLSKYMVVELK